MATRRSHIVELKAGGPDDPDGRYSASVLAAYFNVEQAQTFRRLLWRQSAGAAACACIVEGTTSWLPRGAFFLALLSLAAIVVAAAIVEQRAERSLRSLL